MIMEAIFDFHPALNASTVNPARLGGGGSEVTIEGGDVLVASPEILIIGYGTRTSRQAIDFLIERFKGFSEASDRRSARLGGAHEALNQVSVFLCLQVLCHLPRQLFDLPEST